jgi:ABC-type amino acid transport substrate-binding protein
MTMHLKKPLKTCLTVIAGAMLASACAIGFAAAEPDRLQRIAAAGELRVCIWPDYYGITYRNPKTRTLNGFDIDMSEELARELNVRARYINSAFPQLVDNLVNDKCDIAMHAVGITPAREARLSFSQPYLRSDIYAITTKDNDGIKSWSDLDQPGRVIAVQAGTIMEPVMQSTIRHARLLIVKPPMTREVEVESGRADAFMTDFPYGQRMLDMTDWARLVAPAKSFHLTDYGYAVAPGEHALLSRVNQFIGKLSANGRMREIARKYKLEPILISDENRKRAGAP